MSTQHDTERCQCGGTIRYVATSSQWEFDGQCGTCERKVCVSWAHKADPPEFVASPQGALEFSE